MYTQTRIHTCTNDCSRIRTPCLLSNAMMMRPVFQFRCGHQYAMSCPHSNLLSGALRTDDLTVSNQRLSRCFVATNLLQLAATLLRSLKSSHPKSRNSELGARGILRFFYSVNNKLIHKKKIRSIAVIYVPNWKS